MNCVQFPADSPKNIKTTVRLFNVEVSLLTRQDMERLTSKSLLCLLGFLREFPGGGIRKNKKFYRVLNEDAPEAPSGVIAAPERHQSVIISFVCDIW